MYRGARRVVIGSISAFVAGLGVAGIARASAGEETEAPRVTAVEDLTWTEGVVAVAHLWGDAETGPYGKLVKFPAGLVSPPHYHSNDYTAVIIAGTQLDPIDQSSAARRLGPGAHYFLPGGTVYVVRCVSETPCLIYAHQTGGFDFNRVD